MKIRQFTDLTVWQSAHELALFVYKATENFPDRERFGITAQVRRSSASVAANIAEGFGSARRRAASSASDRAGRSRGDSVYSGFEPGFGFWMKQWPKRVWPV
jgi:hypothetical protein